jgi:FKBP-type peptidyl-prolyl cis-trans isomerase
VASGKIQGDAAPKVAPYTPALPTAKGQSKTTKGGVKYETLKEGTGDELKPGVVALVHYVGTLENGTPFDSSRAKGEPLKAVLGTGRLIKGWEEALPGMKVGEIRKLFIPAAMAYRDQSKPGIPANSNLVFEVELLRIVN